MSTEGAQHSQHATLLTEVDPSFPVLRRAEHPVVGGRMRTLGALVSMALLPVATLGCDDTGRDGRTSPEGPRVVVTIDQSEVLTPRVGSDSLSRAIWRPVALKPFNEARLVVVSAGNGRVIELDSEGTPLQWWGQFGEGPEEFDGLVAAHFCGSGDVLIIQYNRISLFSRSGAFRHSLRNAELIDGGVYETLGVSDDCSAALVEQKLRVYGDSRLNRPITDTAIIAWSSLPDSDVDTVGRFPTEEIILRDVRGSTVPARFAWGIEPQWTVGLGGLVHLPNDRYEIRILSDEGRILKRFTWSGPSRRITDQDWDQYFEVREEIVAESPEEALMIPSREEHPRRPKPVARDLFVDSEDRIWLERFAVPRFVERPPRQVWWVFSEGGAWIAEVMTPPRFRIMAATGEYAWGVTLDDLDRELLARIPLDF